MTRVSSRMGVEIALYGTAAFRAVERQAVGDQGAAVQLGAGHEGGGAFAPGLRLRCRSVCPGPLRQIVRFRSGRRIAATAPERCSFASVGICPSDSKPSEAAVIG